MRELKIQLSDGQVILIDSSLDDQGGLRVLLNDLNGMQNVFYIDEIEEARLIVDQIKHVFNLD